MLHTNLESSLFNAFIQSQHMHTRGTYKPNIYLAKEGQKTSLPHLQSKCTMLISGPIPVIITVLGAHLPSQVKTKNTSTLGTSRTNFQGKMKAYIQSWVEIHNFFTSSSLTRSRAVALFTSSTLEPDGKPRKKLLYI